MTLTNNKEALGTFSSYREAENALIGVKARYAQNLSLV
jgi:hypothetical protein